MREWFGEADPKRVEFNSNVGQNLADYIKSISGATVTNAERDTLMKLIPGVADDDEEFNAKLKALRDKIEFYRRAEVDTLRASGKVVNPEMLKTSSYKQPTSAAPEQNTMVVINTPKGRKSVPKADLDRYLKAGATLAE